MEPPYALALKSDGRGSNLATVISLFSFFLFFSSLFVLHFNFNVLGLERTPFTEYKYYLPFSHNKLSNTVTLMGSDDH